ncbi:TIGR04104 family putative zinc finger protein [Planococcus halocryophilus]|uniref:TIGR04104 family putative zinc finger protein n=1 Tax=Planococcus halocryophilus TaxID=1215089 RepID=UPI001F113D9E|nr:TIGR04104 family putative zinc finger protein [Planococcus halocryophilus]MCH4825401.1 hypothetical protein [Planococcus halocryophilus]
MPTCENCGQKWPWKKIVSNTFKLTNKANCPYCGTTQYIVVKSKPATAILNFLPAFLIITVGMIFDISVPQVLMFAVVLVIIFLIIYPFTFNLSSDEKTLN